MENPALATQGIKQNYFANRKKFEHQEFNGDLGLNLYEFKWRDHDPQIGRFLQIDPLADKYEYNSTYAFCENKVTSYIELEGLEAYAEWRVEKDLSDVQSGKITSEQLDQRLQIRGKSDVIAVGVGAAVNEIGLGIINLIKSAFKEYSENNNSNAPADKTRNAPNQEGTPNSSKIETKDAEGKTTKYSTYDKNGKLEKQVEADRGVPRHGIPGATKKLPTENKLPDGTVKPGKMKIEPAEPHETPPGNNVKPK